MNNQKMPALKPIISVTEMAKNLNLSRARFYQLLESGFFPKPLYDERSKRPYYDANLQAKILESRHTGINEEGSFMLFYSPRKKEAQSRNSIKLIKKDSVHVEFAETLNSMGLDCSVKDVSSSITELYPEGIGDLHAISNP